MACRSQLLERIQFGINNIFDVCCLFFIGRKMLRHSEPAATQALVALLDAIQVEAKKWVT